MSFVQITYHHKKKTTDVVLVCGGYEIRPRVYADIYIYIPPILLWERREKEVVHANHISVSS